ncbi:MAG: ACT domain-containing protein [Thioalkalispiraceae bacterium]|jgi:glycine cleavage system transcriptional repressor
MLNWYMLTLVGRDRPGIVAQVTNTLFEAGCQLGEASMMRLGGNFTVMLMVQSEHQPASLESTLQEKLSDLDLRLHIDPIEGHLHEHIIPDVCVSVYGADRPGIVAEVTHVLQKQDFHILDLESDVAGSEEKPIYIMHIEGKAQTAISDLEKELDKLREDGIDVKVSPVDTLIG